MSLRILVTSAGGRVGKEVVAHIRSWGKDVFIRACCRRPDRSQFLKELGADEVVEMDYSNEATFEKALEGGINVVFSSSPDPQLKGHKAFMLRVKAVGGVKHIVRLSCFGAEQNTAIYNMNQHVSNEAAKVPHFLVGYWEGEQACIETGVPTTAIRGNFFMNHLLKTEVENIEKNGQFKTPLEGCRNSFVCTNDLGEVSALCIKQGPGQHGNKFYDVTGPEPQSMYEVAQTLSKVLGKEIRYTPQNVQEFLKDFGPTRSEFFEYLRNGFYTRVSPDFYNLTGKRSTSYYEYLTKKGAAGETGLEELYQAGCWTKGKDIMKEETK